MGWLPGLALAPFFESQTLTDSNEIVYLPLAFIFSSRRFAPPRLEATD